MVQFLLNVSLKHLFHLSRISSHPIPTKAGSFSLHTCIYTPGKSQLTSLAIWSSSSDSAAKLCEILDLDPTADVGVAVVDVDVDAGVDWPPTEEVEEGGGGGGEVTSIFMGKEVGGASLPGLLACLTY